MSSVSSPVSAQSPASVGAPSSAAWAIAVFVGCIVAWIGYNFPPIHWRIPDDMTHIGALSPPEDQAKLAAVEKANKWKNTLLKYSLAGLGIGLAGVVLYASSLAKNIGTAVTVLIVGLISGAVSGTISLVVRQYLDLEHPIPLVSDQMRPLFCDTVVFAIGSVILLVPIATLLRMSPRAEDRHKALSVPLAGLLTGLVVPLTVATLSGVGVLAIETNTSFFPPLGLGLTTTWFVALALLTALMLNMAGKKPTAAKDSVA